ncbi:CBS domain pair protein [Nautilia profundicola AmH]|uniref:CBS domain pair protein n=1 Tax=Nautilia profundicola (strain ATCC BAA-1463 / DSM 18972 / AmH) TaxID=598659 RepID=B9L886_NAUPA|nr:diguanylate cyclase [Nautilia profundicola]ACM92312.1 CBS domain pair protein [Nautilia profundicola AmH]
MTLKNYLEKVCYKDIEDLKEKTLADLIAYMYKCDSSTFYVVRNKKPIYIFTSTDMLEIFMKNLLSMSIEEYINKNPKQLKKLSIKTNILDAYYFMRSHKLKHIPIVNENEELLGEISFKTLSLKIADIVIKDPLTGLFNQKYFDVLLEEYNEFNKPLGIIFVELKNMNILEGFYGAEKINEIIKTYADAIKECVREIDFVFRMGYRFKILTFNNLEITDKIVRRIREKLENTDYEGIKVSFEIAFSHVPELEDNVLTAIESCEKKLIERD